MSVKTRFTIIFFPSALGAFRRAAKAVRKLPKGAYLIMSQDAAKSIPSVGPPWRSSKAPVRYSSRQGPDSD